MDAGIRYLGGPDAGPSRQAQAQVDPQQNRADTSEIHLRGLRHHTSAEKFSFGERRGSVGDGAGASGSGGQEEAGPDSDGRGGKGEDHAAAHPGAAQELPEDTDTRPLCGHRPQHRAPPIRFSALLARSLPSCRRCWSASAPTAGPEKSDSDGTSEVSLESEPGDQSVAGATFLGSDGMKALMGRSAAQASAVTLKSSNNLTLGHVRAPRPKKVL